MHRAGRPTFFQQLELLLNFFLLTSLLFYGSIATADAATAAATFARIPSGLRQFNASSATLAAARDRTTTTTLRSLEEDAEAENNVTAKNVYKYTLWPSEKIHMTLQQWKKHYMDVLRVTTAQETYGLPTAGTSEDCPAEEDQDGCLNYIFTIQDFVAHPEGSESSKRLPSVLLSGLLHGDEQVGPTAVLEASQLLMDAAQCERLPRMALKDSIDWDHELNNAKACRQNFADIGITESGRQWLARLVSTRKIVVVPTANALGYYRTRREEDHVDPNRDFPYDLTDPTDCMQTVAARTLNEVFRDNLFQLSFTFHGGMEVIGYEWGAPSYSGKTSPDDFAQTEIASAYSRYGGGWDRVSPYNFGNMNDLVYPVRGGMEDWAYAGSWDPERVIQCQPTTFGGYPAEKTTYGPSTLRVFNMLVESSDVKIPPAHQLGTSEDILKGGSTTGNGYVARNIRLSLLAIDMVEPYAAIMQVNELELSGDLVPLTERGGRSCQESKLVAVPDNSRKVVIRWKVGGAITIDQTQLWYGLWSDIPPALLDCMTQPNPEDIRKYMRNGTMISDSSGFGPHSKTPSGWFSASMDIDDYNDGDTVAVLAVARVDQGWSRIADNVAPNVPPQSHIVNARTNASWYHEIINGDNTGGMIIQGRLDWFSIPLTIVLEKRTLTDSDADVVAVELSNRFLNKTVDAAEAENDSNEASNPNQDGTSSSSSADKGETPVPTTKTERTTMAVIVLVTILLLACLCRLYFQHRMRVARREQVREFIEDETAPQPGLRQRSSKKNAYSDVNSVDSDDGEVEMGEMT